MVVKATSTITCLLLSFLAIQTSKAEGDLLWTSLSEIQPSVDSNIEEHVFIESSSHSKLSEMLTNFINRLDLNENIGNTANIKHVPSLISKPLCQKLHPAFPKSQHQTLYIFQGSSSEPAIIYNCDESFSLIIAEVNPEVLSLKPLEKQTKIWRSILKDFDLKTFTIEIGSVCQKELHFDKKLGKCAHKNRKLSIEEDYEEFKNSEGVETAIAMLGFEELNADLIELMFNDLLDTIIRPVSGEYFDVFVCDISILMGPIHHDYTSEELMEAMYGYLWTDMTLDDETPSESSLSYILDQSSLYLYYYDYLEDSFSKVDSWLSSFFSYYAYNALYIGMYIDVISDAYDLAINVHKSKYLFEDQTTFDNVVGSRSYSISNCELFLTTDAWSVFVIDYSYIENVNQHFSVHLYRSGASDTETNSEYLDFEDEEKNGSANRFLMTVELDNSFESTSRIYCKGQPCIVSDEDSESDTVTLSFGTAGYVEIVPYSCEGESIYLEDYIEYRDSDGPEIAISIYSLIEDADQCFLLQMWEDLKGVLISYSADSDQFAFFNGALISLMDPMHFDSLTEDMMNDMLGYSWVISTYIPDYIYSEVSTSVIDQFTFYIEYFNYTEESFDYVDKTISRYFMFYADKEMVLGLDIAEFLSTEDLTPTSIKAEIVKIYGSDLNGYNIGGGTYNSVGLFEDNDIVSVLNIAYMNSKFVADVISVHLYYAGVYSDEDQGEGYKQEEISFVDTSYSISFESEDTVLCIKEDCEDSQNSENYENTITVTKEGIYYFMKDCGDSSWNKEKLDCNLVCDEGLFLTEDNTCEACNVDKCEKCSEYSVCEKCLDNYFLTEDFACEPCNVENCETCSEYSICEICVDNYFLTEDFACETCDIEYCVTCENAEECEVCDDNYIVTEDKQCGECSLSNCAVCLTYKTCDECNKNYFLTSDLKCDTCSVSNCKECSAYSECKTCNSNYYLKTDYQCDTCNTPCVECKDSKDKCTKCGTLASLAGDKCTCITNASFDTDKTNCTCKSDYIQIGEGTSAVCQSCKHYINENNLISAAYSENMKFLYVNFNISIETRSKCSDLITNYLTLGNDAKCEIISNKQIKITLGSSWSILDGPIILNSENIIQKTKTSTSCSITAPDLSISPTHNSALTTPQAILYGPTNFYGKCSDSSATFSAKDTYDITGLGLKYIWTFANLTKISSYETLIEFFSKQTSSKFEIDIQKYFETYNGGLDITVNVSNAFNEWSTKKLSLIFQSISGLTVSIEGGNIYKGYADSRLEFKAIVDESCGAKGDITYKWKRVDNNGHVSEDLNNLESGKKLVLKKGVLKSDKIYIFTVVASRGGISGTATVEIHTIGRELEVILDAPQMLPAGKNLKVSAKRSKDPNDDNTKLDYAWTCEISGKECSKELTVELDEKNSYEIEIDQVYLPAGKTVTISVNVSSESQYKTAQVNVEINGKIKTTTNIYGPPGRVSRSRDCKITSNIELSGKKTSDMFVWTIPSGLSIKKANEPFLYISAGTFTSDKSSYQFILTVNDEETYTITIDISVNYPPSCTGTKISPESGDALFTQFLLEATCEDPEEDYPLFAIAGFNFEGNEMSTGHKGNGREKSSRFPKGEFEVYLLVCDTMGDCFKATFKLKVNIRKRMLSIEDEYMASYEEIKSEDADSIPGTMTIIANTYEVNITNLEYFLHDLIEYDTNQTSKDIDLLHLELAAIMSLVNSYQIPTITLAFIDELYSFTYNMLIEFSTSSSFLTQTLTYITNIAGSIRNYDVTNMELLEMSKNLTSIGVSILMVDKLPLFEYVEENSDYYSFTKRYKLDEIINIGIPPNKTIAEFKEVGGYRDSEEDSDTEHLFDVVTSIYYNGSEFSSPVETTIRPAGKIVNYTYYPELNDTDPITEFEDSILLYMQVTENVTIDFQCGYLDGGQVVTVGCKIIEISDDLIATIEVNHLSVYIIIEPETSSSEDQNDYAPFIILLIVFFIELIALPYAMMADNMYAKQLISNVNEDQGFTKTFEGTPASPAGSERPLTSFASSLPDIEDISDDCIDQNKDSEFTIMFVLKPYGSSERKIQKIKGWFENMLEGHLLFGLIFYRPTFTRALRIITIFTTVILHLLLEGLFYYHSYDYESGIPRSTQNLFNTYEGDYFAFALVSLAIALPVEVFLIVVFSHERAKYVTLHLFALVLALLITIGAFIGVFILTFMFDFQWNGYWAVSFLWSILIELFFLQAIYMFTRYFIFREKGENKATKNS